MEERNKRKIIERKCIGIDKWVCKSQKNEGTYETINYWTEVVKSVARSDPSQRRGLKTHPPLASPGPGPSAGVRQDWGNWSVNVGE
jgi:hypothetical protein